MCSNAVKAVNPDFSFNSKMYLSTIADISLSLCLMILHNSAHETVCCKIKQWRLGQHCVFVKMYFCICKNVCKEKNKKHKWRMWPCTMKILRASFCSRSQLPTKCYTATSIMISVSTRLAFYKTFLKRRSEKHHFLITNANRSPCYEMWGVRWRHWQRMGNDFLQ